MWFREMSVRGIARSGNCPWGNCPLGKFPSGKCLRGTIRRGNVLQGNIRRGTALEPTKRSKHFNCYTLWFTVTFYGCFVYSYNFGHFVTSLVRYITKLEYLFTFLVGRSALWEWLIKRGNWGRHLNRFGVLLSYKEKTRFTIFQICCYS